jgi:hypothetical protein
MIRGQFLREITMPDETTKSDHGIVDFPGLRRNPSLPEARVAGQIGYGLDFGKGKCSVTVSLACDQTEDMIDLAGDMALHKADELADVGMRIVMGRLEEP